jgi:EmrB/QacA subfamily drug resistance transporter
MALFMVMLDSTVVNVALPAIQRSFGATLAGLQWTVTAYTLAFAALLVSGGRLGDLIGRRRVFLWGLVLFAAASAAIAAVPSHGALVAARAVQGAGAALMMPSTLSIIASVFAPEERARAIGVWAGVSGAGLAAGPVVGGLLTDGLSWRAIFLLNVPVAACAIAVTLRATPESRDEGAGSRLDPAGTTVLVAALGALVLGLTQGNAWGWASPRTAGLLAGGCAGLLAFVALEGRVRHPTVELPLLRARAFLAAVLVSLALSFVMFAGLFYVALHLQGVLGHSATETGLLLLPATVLVMVSSPAAGRLTGRLGPRRVAMAGMALVAASAWIASRVTESSGYGLLLPSLVAMGVGIGLVVSPVSAAGMNALPVAKAGVASGILSMSRMVGGTFGIAVVGAVVEREPTFVAGLGAGMAVAAGVGVAGCLAAAALPGAPRLGRHVDPHAIGAAERVPYLVDRAS